MVANVKVEPVREEALPRVLTATGKIQFNEDQTARVLAPLPGQVLDLQASASATSVEKDSVLFSIKSREVAGLVTDLMQAQREQDLAEKTYTMTKDLFEHQAAARIALQQAEGDLAKAKAQTARAEEALRVFGLDPAEVLATNGVRTLIPVRSPMSGTVIERTVTPGQFVQGDNTPLLTIVDHEHGVGAGGCLRDATSTWCIPASGWKSPPRPIPTATSPPRVDRISDKVDPETRTLKVRLLVSNPGLLLKPEMFITASLVVNEKTRRASPCRPRRCSPKATAAMRSWPWTTGISSAAWWSPRARWRRPPARDQRHPRRRPRRRRRSPAAAPPPEAATAAGVAVTSAPPRTKSMIRRLATFALNQPLFVFLLTGLFILGGVIAFKNLSIEAFPDVTDIQVTVITLYPGYAAEEVEKQVTTPLEIGLSRPAQRRPHVLPHAVRAVLPDRHLQRQGHRRRRAPTGARTSARRRAAGQGRDATGAAHHAHRRAVPLPAHAARATISPNCARCRTGWWSARCGSRPAWPTWSRSAAS